jgi:hypothetical protein
MRAPVAHADAEYIRADIAERQIAELRDAQLAETQRAWNERDGEKRKRLAAEAENARLRALPLKDEVEQGAGLASLVELIHLRILAISEGKPSAKKQFAIDELRSLLSRLRAGEQDRDGLSEWAGWDKAHDPWGETKHKDAVLEALFRGPWSVEDAATLIGFIDRTWTRRPAAPKQEESK